MLHESSCKLCGEINNLHVHHDLDFEYFAMNFGQAQFGLVRYVQNGDVLRLTHSEVPQSLRGKGCGKVLMEYVLQHIENDGFKIIPECSFIRHYLASNTQWAHLIAN